MSQLKDKDKDEDRENPQRGLHFSAISRNEKWKQAVLVLLTMDTIKTLCNFSYLPSWHYLLWRFCNQCNFSVGHRKLDWANSNILPLSSSLISANDDDYQRKLNKLEADFQVSGKIKRENWSLGGRGKKDLHARWIRGIIKIGKEFQIARKIGKEWKFSNCSKCCNQCQAAAQPGWKGRKGELLQKRGIFNAINAPGQCGQLGMNCYSGISV